MKGKGRHLAYGFSSLHTQILRMAVGSEYQKSFFMPPRAVGETLPPEVMEDHETQRRPEAQQAELKAMAEAKARAEAEAKAAAGQKNSEGLVVSILPVVTAETPAHTPGTLCHLALQGKPMLLAAACPHLGGGTLG